VLDVILEAPKYPDPTPLPIHLGAPRNREGRPIIENVDATAVRCVLQLSSKVEHRNGKIEREERKRRGNGTHFASLAGKFWCLAWNPTPLPSLEHEHYISAGSYPRQQVEKTHVAKVWKSIQFAAGR
jgi:hypothetical protein